jgi:hypothetical protein
MKGDLQNEQDEGARGVEVDGRGDKLRGDSESLLSALAFSKIQVPQGWMEGNSSRKEEQIVFALHAPFDDSQRSRQGRDLGEGNCTFSHEEIPAYEMQP